MYKKAYKIIVIMSIIGLILPFFALSVHTGYEGMEIPKTLKEAEKMGQEAGERAVSEMPGILKGVWQKEVLPVWRGIWDLAEKLWNLLIFPSFKGFFAKEIEPRIKKEVKKRRPVLEKELQKEQEELKEDLPKISKGVWERFKELIK
jgi:hypothetical protein